MGARSRLRARVSVLAAVGALLVAGGVALLLSNTFELRGSAASANRAERHLVRVIEVERLVVDAETGLRGEIITGRKLFLQPVYSAQSQLPGAITALRQAAAGNHAYQQQTDALIAAVRSYMNVYVAGVLRMAAHDLSAARAFSVTLEGKRRVDGIRARVAGLEGSLSSSEAARQQSARATANRSITEAVIVLVLLTVLTAALSGYLGHLVVTRERAREHSAETVRTLQSSILPAAVPAIPGCEVATRFIPGGGAVSGDFYDVFELEPGAWALVIGDVCGKGTAAAAATAMARWTLRSSLSLGAAPVQALRFLNDVALGRQRDCRFITAVCLKMTQDRGLATVDIASAGHPAPILVPSAGVPAAVAARGDLLGVSPTIDLEPVTVQLHGGDSLVAYTDGVTDQGPEARRSPEQALHDRRQGADADQLAEILVGLASRPVGRHPDDIAIVALRYVGRIVPLTLAAAAGARHGAR